MEEQLFPKTASEKLDDIRVYIEKTVTSAEEEVARAKARVTAAQAKVQNAERILANFDDAIATARDQEGKVLWTPRIDLTTGKVME